MEITGRHVLIVTVGAFAVVIGVNVLMAVKAVSTFPGLEVRNSYVASQTFDADRAAQEALGWTLRAEVADGALTVALTDAAGQPAKVVALSGKVGRATSVAEDRSPPFEAVDGVFRAAVDLAPGAWTLWVEATAADGTVFRQRLPLTVRP
jgi:nitrogen fixation protein FixH